MIKRIDIQSKSEVLSATVYESTDTKAILIIASATGVKQEFYHKFSRYLQENGITVITFDYGGIGQSLKRPIKKLKNNAVDWGKDDLESIINYVLENYPSHQKCLLGHSMGGQLIGLARSSTQMDKIILVAAQSGYWKFWTGFARSRMWFNWHVLFPLLINLFGYFPSKKVSRMENLPRNVAKQWSNWGKHPNYIFSELSADETVYEKLTVNMVAYSIEDDKFAPKKAVDWMTAKYCNARVKTAHLQPKKFETNSIGHFGVFRGKFENTIWKRLLSEMD